MNLSTCTPGQRQSIEHVRGPLLVSAGAGSGKTFTLTQRIAYALLPESGPAASGVDEVLAITFTEKAAAEIKARVKRTLRAEGLAEEALRVDGAWISTIHGMCARILRAHALDLGLDPAFGIMGDAERAEAVADAIDGALGDDNDIIARGSYAALFDEYPARSTMPLAPSVASMLQALMDKAAGLRGGLDALDFGPSPAQASTLARELLLAYEGVLPALERAGKSASAERARAAAADAVEALGAFLADASAASDARALAAVVDGCAYLPCTFGGADVKAEVKAYQAVHARVAQNVALALAHPLASELMALAREVTARFEGAKRAACKLDNDDLLVRTLDAFERCPDIAARYERRFKLVMVDEFQDTSQLQIDMIARLAGPRCAHLCTVGDAQQSIYRFRGADVNVYEAHKKAMRADEVGALYVELTKNFRSHGDVLSFVDRVFEQSTVFGEAFMSLEPNEQRPSCYRGSAPRIDLVLSVQPAGRGTGVRTADAKRAGAEAIARRFAALREDGHAPGDMVVLLGKMSRAGMYAEALRAEGFECVVTGGSLFASAPEVRVVARFVEALANPANTAALFEVLTSDMMRLSADDLLVLTTEEDPETGCVRRRDLDRGFARLASRADGLPPRLAHAVRLFERARDESRTRPVATVVRDAVVRSGWMARLEEEGAAGTARAANVLKAVRLVDRLETERHLGLASTARALADELAVGLKEAPGALSGAGGDVVKIMTIHASKGLEFPVVALADFADARAGSGKLLVETCGAIARASLAPAASLEAFPQLAKRSGAAAAGDGEDDADLLAARRLVEGEDGPACALGASSCTQAAYRAQLARRAADEELAEARRKLYVGLTRASEALVVAMDAKAPSAGKPPAYAPLVDDIRSALRGRLGARRRFSRGRCRASLRRHRAGPLRAHPRAAAGAARRGGCRACARTAAVLRARRGRRFAVDALRGRLGARRCVLVLVDRPEPASGSGGRGRAFRRGRGQGDGSGQRLPSGCAAGRRDGKGSRRCAPRRALRGVRSIDGTARAAGRCLRALVLQRDVRRNAAVGAAARRGAVLRADIRCVRGRGDRPSVHRRRAACGRSCARGGLQDRRFGRRGAGSAALQAQCYAYALLRQGCVEVELRFARVEREDSAGGMQTVTYRFTAEDLDGLAVRILSARRA